MNVKQGRVLEKLSTSAGPTANERFKASFGAWLCCGIMAATALHFAVIQFFPALTAADLSFGVMETQAIELPPEVEIPPPPEAIARPAVPVVAHTVLDEDITIAPTTFEHNPVESLPPPPSRDVDVREKPVYIARDVEPRLTNGPEVGRLLTQMYPEMLREAGIGGTVVLWVFVETDGQPGACQVHRSSGYSAFDETAERIATRMVFRPAMSRDRPVAVWISRSLAMWTKRNSSGER